MYMYIYTCIYIYIHMCIIEKPSSKPLGCHCHCPQILGVDNLPISEEVVVSCCIPWNWSP